MGDTKGQLSLQLELTLSRPQKARRKNDIMTLGKRFPRSPIITTTRGATTLKTIPSQKTIYSLSNLYISDC